jgi:TRAP-type C4-dicarboxylate transport system permease small subunit
MSNKVYDALKWITMVVLPAMASLYTGLAGVWGLPLANEIPDTIMVIVTFLGIVLGISSAQYKKKVVE